MDADKLEATQTLQRRVDEGQATADRLAAELAAARAEVARLQEKEVRAAEETARAIARALDVQREGLEREKAAQQRWLKEDNQRIKAEAARAVEDAVARHDLYTAHQRQQYAETKDVLAGDKARLEAERDVLRAELAECRAQLSTERGGVAERLKEERVAWDQELRDARKEAVRMQAALRSEALSALDRTKAQLEMWHHERYAELQQTNERERSALIAENERLRALLGHAQAQGPAPPPPPPQQRPSAPLAPPPPASMFVPSAKAYADPEPRHRSSSSFSTTAADEAKSDGTHTHTHTQPHTQHPREQPATGPPTWAHAVRTSHANAGGGDLGAMLATEVALLVSEVASVDTAVDKITLAAAHQEKNSGVGTAVHPSSTTRSISSSSSSSSSSGGGSSHEEKGRAAPPPSDVSSRGSNSFATLLAQADAQIRTLGERSRSPRPPPPPPATYAPPEPPSSSHVYPVPIPVRAPSFISAAHAPATVHASYATSTSNSRSHKMESPTSVPRLSDLLDRNSSSQGNYSSSSSNSSNSSSNRSSSAKDTATSFAGTSTVSQVEQDIRLRLRNLGAALSPSKRRASAPAAVAARQTSSSRSSSALNWGLLKKSMEAQEVYDEQAPTPSPTQRVAAATYAALHAAQNRTKTSPTVYGRGGKGRLSRSAPASATKAPQPPPLLPASSSLTRSTGHSNSAASMFRRGGSGKSLTTADAAGSSSSSTTTRPRPASAFAATSSSSSSSSAAAAAAAPSGTATRLDDILGRLGEYIDAQGTAAGAGAGDDDVGSEDSLLHGLKVAFLPRPPPAKKDEVGGEEYMTDESYQTTPASVLGSML